jgi:hypothetical protein
VDEFDEVSAEIPQLVLLGFGVRDRAWFDLTASIARGTSGEPPLTLRAALRVSVEVVGPAGRLVWAEGLPVTVTNRTGGGDVLTVDAGDPPLTFDLTLAEDALLPGHSWERVLKEITTLDSSTRLTVVVQDPGIARYRAAVAAQVYEDDSRVAGSWPPVHW